jgi:hypothetical protein
MTDLRFYPATVGKTGQVCDFCSDKKGEGEKGLFGTDGSFYCDRVCQKSATPVPA